MNRKQRSRSCTPSMEVCLRATGGIPAKAAERFVVTCHPRLPLYSLALVSFLGILAVPDMATAGTAETSVAIATPTPAAGNSLQAPLPTIEKLAVSRCGAVKQQPLDFQMGDVFRDAGKSADGGIHVGEFTLSAT